MGSRGLMVRLAIGLLSLVATMGLITACGGGDDDAEPASTSADSDDGAVESNSGADTGDDAGGTTIAAPTATAAPTPTPTPTLGPITTPTVSVVLRETAFTNASRVSTAGIDEIIFSMEAEAAAAAASTAWVGVPEGSRPECYVVVPANGPEGVSFWVWSGLIERVDITTPALRTRSGYGVGTQVDQLRSELGDLVTVSDLGTGQRVVFTPSDPGDQYRLVFDASDGEVTSFRAGRANLIDGPSGDCGPTPDAGLINPGISDAACNQLGIDSVSVSLPPEVAATARALQEAARECNVDRLITFAGSELVAGIAGGTFEEVHADDGRAISSLAWLMSFEPAIQSDGAGGDLYVWPRAFTVDWADVTDEMKAELRQLGYTEQDYPFFEEIGFFGLRTAIDTTGRWVYFLEGD